MKITSVKERLEKELQEAEQEQKLVDKRLEHRPDLGPGEGSPGAQSWEMALMRKEEVAARIEALQEALDRVRDGAYGRCEQCGAQIQPERLEILPTTTFCVRCAQQLETNSVSGS
jgi:RNA polymerase-binding transcription factor DksA